jgi:Fe-S cluster assembly protein SufD
VQPKASFPEGVIVGSLKEAAEQHPDLVAKYYAKQAQDI